MLELFQKEEEEKEEAWVSGSLQLKRAQGSGSPEAARGEVKSLLLNLFTAPPGVYNSLKCHTSSSLSPGIC